jgi:uncharacterized damage-inducible protein DinB
MESAVPSKAGLLRHIAESRARLDDIVSPLSEPELTEPGDEGWSVKDHLAHLAAWEESLLALLEGRDRDAALGLPPATLEAGNRDVDWVNARIFEQNQEKPLDQVLEEYRASHARVLAAIGRLSDADLLRPYSSFQPGSEDERPVINWINGDTWEHDDEHLGWITAILDTVGPTI